MTHNTFLSFIKQSSLKRQLAKSYLVFVQQNAACKAAKTCDGSLQRPYPSLQAAANYFYYYSYVVNNIVLFPGHYNASKIKANNVVLHI